MIPFNKPYLTGNETKYIEQAVFSGKISGNGLFTHKCQYFFEQQYNIKKCLLTSSCTDALEMCAILTDLQPEDEVIVPSFTFVSTALAFVREKANIIFADSCVQNPNIDTERLEILITPKTKAIVVVHYAGIACDMDKVMELAEKYNLLVIEDVAHAIDSYYISPKTGEKKALGSIGHLAAFSFHETKNIISGEGGMLAINDERFINRAEVIWGKGTNRVAFFRGEVNKYEWIDTGSSFLLSEINAAFLWAQIENLEKIQNRRKQIWNLYYEGLKNWAEKNEIMLPFIPNYATNNGHMFYLMCKNNSQRTALLESLNSKDFQAVFHYLSLHKSPYYSNKYKGEELSFSDRYSECLLRLPFYYELEDASIGEIIKIIRDF